MGGGLRVMGRWKVVGWEWVPDLPVWLQGRRMKKGEKGKEGDAKGKGKAKEVEGMGESGMEEVRIHFAGLLPGLARWSQLALRVYLMSLLIRYWRRMKSRFFRRLCLGGLRMPLGMS
ncbi:hypothetical protein CC1G_01644 [Coprinopsis cinerea okayama7|uniref:Uncharacterized protein n=1 Tax=Coprinopsis cinerea (strain Okayama-7 / 130 / ATCC MYA-4618 / FGSC 9003) TaxID=240176 RepID=A8NIC6_COPC7|nr:hypothetical protein CC1G_01644 [Coprinopsis cinerea okayama7\|eukprot:XP_001833967.2 hypothetical protein CC1G_01644 [Coprinopsis cinerea okayama7\